MDREIPRREYIGGIAGVLTVSNVEESQNQPKRINSIAPTGVDWPLEWLISRVQIVFDRYPTRGFTRRELAHQLSLIEAADTPGKNLNEFVADPQTVIHGALLLSALRELQMVGKVGRVKSDGQIKFFGNPY